jgi:hypothetical protein
MQIHEITTLNENFLKRLATDARNDAFKKATGVDWNTYKLAQTTPLPASAPAAPAPAPAAAAAAPKPAATTVTPTGFNAGNVLNLPGVKQAPATVLQSPEQIRKAKQALAAQTARDQMTGKTTAQPAATVPSAAAPIEKPGFLKTATDKIADRNKTQAPPTTSTAPAATPVAPAAAPVVYQFDGRPLNPQNTRDSAIIAQLQAAGVTSATSGIKKTK